MRNQSWTFYQILELNLGKNEEASYMIETLLKQKRILLARAKNLDEYIPNCDDFSEDEFVFPEEWKEKDTRNSIGFRYNSMVK